MDLLNFFLSVGIIGGADGPTAVTVSGLPLPALTVALFAIGFIAYVYIAKAVASKKAPDTEKTIVPSKAASTVTATVAAPVYTGPVLTGIEDKEAAVIMAIVSDKTGIPLERLKFESIKLLEDK